MREPILVGSSPSNFLPLNNNPKHKPYFIHPTPKTFTAKVSSSSSSSSNSTSTTTATGSSTSSAPLLMNVHQDINNRLKYYADLASKLVEDGRLEDFLMIIESVLGLGIEPSLFVSTLNTKLVSVGFCNLISNGKIRDVVEVLSKVEKLGISSVSLFDKSVKKAISLECRRLVDVGKLNDVVDTMAALSGFDFPIKHLVDPIEIIKLCVKKHEPNMVVRYACLLPQAQILYTLAIQEFGKKRDLDSALIAYEASKRNGPNMYAWRSIIDVCGLCGDFLKSRQVYEELVAQKVTPNSYVCNSLMNVNAHDLSYILHVYKEMQTLGVAADLASYNILLKACCLAGRVDLARDIYKEIRHKASTGTLKLDVITYSTIIKVFADAKMWQMALKTKEDMLLAGVTPNEVTWSSLITACANVGLVEQAIQIFEEMIVTGCEPNTQCCNTLLYACVEARQYDRAFRIFQSWKEGGISKGLYSKEFSRSTRTLVSIDVKQTNGIATKNCHSDQLHLSKVVRFRPTIATYNILMKACGTDYYRAKALMDDMKFAGLSPNHISWSILMDIYGTSGDIGGALRGLKSMRDAGIKPDVIAYTTTIKACVANKNLSLAFTLFEEMKKYQLQPNLVTYNTLLRARNRYGSAFEVQQCLAIYQDMQKAGYAGDFTSPDRSSRYSSNDSYLKELIEEWCEGVIQGRNQNQEILGQNGSRDKTAVDKSHSLLFEKVATHLQKDITETRAVDIRGLTKVCSVAVVKVEARIVVLAVLRMIRESYAQGNPVKDDLIILLGIGEGIATVSGSESEVQDSIVKLLQDELSLTVLSTGPRYSVASSNDQGNPLISDPIHENLEQNSNFESPARRPVVLRRLKITRKSLYNWLQRKSSRLYTKSS
ncbi:hypothetical protein C5167_000734 [Papaver somniferum]|uniref:PROP1-like PPR domain-containing protein n=1 Tax=Papaver somniferum TaxID=3469 RepID=A0A4Y7KT76_PAPSO|nr:hypothetical protein C5167_000734 [Papaver somniferum]